MTSSPAPVTPSSPPPTSEPGKSARWRRLLLLVFGGLLLLSLLFALLLWSALQSETGSRAVWQVALWAAQGRISGTYAGGSLAHGVQLRDVNFNFGATHFSVDQIDGSWQWSRAPLTLTVDYLRLGKAVLQLAPTPEPSPPLQLPKDLQLPLAVQLHAVSLQQLAWRHGADGTSMQISGLRLHAISDGQQHRVMLEQLATPYGTASGQVQLDGRAPFAVKLDALLGGSYQEQKFQLDAHASGVLAALTVNLHASGDKLAGDGQLELTPFAAQALVRAQIRAQHIDPKLFNQAAPHADLSVFADLKPSTTEPGSVNSGPASNDFSVTGPITVKNALAGTLDADRLPLVSASAYVHLSPSSQQLSQIQIDLLQNASLRGAGQLQPSEQGRHGEFRLDINALDLHALHSQLRPTQLHGLLTLQLQADSQQVQLELADRRIQLQTRIDLQADQIKLERLHLKENAAQLDLSGSLARGVARAYQLSGTLRDFDPAQWMESGAGKQAQHNYIPQARINLDFDAGGVLAPSWLAKLKFNIHDSSYDQLPLLGSGTLNLAEKRLLPSDLQLDIAGNQININGSFGAPGDSLQMKVQAPQLARLGYGLQGSLELDGAFKGSLQQAQIQADYRAEKLVFGAYRLAQADGHIKFDGALDLKNKSPKQVVFALNAQNYQGPELRLDQLHLNLTGSDRQHQLRADAEGKLRGHALALQLAAHGGLLYGDQSRAGSGPAEPGVLWSGVVDSLENKGQPRFALVAPAILSVGNGQLALGPAKLSLAGAALELKNLSFAHGAIRSEGSAAALDIASLLQLQSEFTGQPVPLKTDLVLNASWNFSLGEQASGFLQIARERGDVRIDSGQGVSNLGLSMLQLRANLLPTGLQLDLQTAAAAVGKVSAQALLGWQRRSMAGSQRQLLTLTPASSISAQASGRVPNLKTVAPLVGPQLSLQGSLALDLQATGSLAAPHWSGAISGDKLALTLFDLGIQLHDGTVRIGLNQNEIDLQQIEFHGGEGTLHATGKLKLGEADPTLSAMIVADKLQLFASPERRLTLSGRASIAELDQHLQIDGKVRVDSALFDLPKKSAPKLGDDVVVIRRKAGSGKQVVAAPQTTDTPIAARSKKPASPWSPVINLQVDLGNDFRFRGAGADLLLRGVMTVHSEPYAPLRAGGTVRVVQGTYEVFGRKLAIERGLLNFQGPIDNPNINILAMRRNQEVEAGVEVTGLAQQPRVRLVSEPSVAEEEKLSWLMFGHGLDSGGLGQRQAASAALALLGSAGGKRLAQGVGLDQFSIGASESGLADQQVVNLGKALSERFYVGYEQSLTDAARIIKLTYQLSKNWSLVARAGAISGLDVLFNQRFD